MKEKLKVLKEKLMMWNMEVFGKVNLEVQVAVKELSNLDVLDTQNLQNA